MTSLWKLTATELVTLIRNREVSATEITQSTLSRLDDVNPELNAVVQDTRDTALQDAAKVDQLIQSGDDPGPMAGVPVTIKVNVDQAGYATTNGLKLQKNKVATEDCPVVRSLRQAGAVIVGRTNTPAFSLRWFTRNTLHGATVNPLNAAITPGGSSGGAASAAAAGIGAIAHGSDIAGSVRYPAYACGIHGLRPSFGRVAAYNPSSPDRFIAGQMLAVSGPLARSMNDIELGLHVMSQPDTRDPWWVPAGHLQPAFEKRVALCTTPEGWKVDPVVLDAVQSAARTLEYSGWHVEEVACPPIRQAAALNLTLWMAEMERVGINMVTDEDDPDATIVFKRLCAHTHSVDAAGLMDAMQARIALTRQWQQFLADYPVMLCAVSGQLPFANHSDVQSATGFDDIVEAQLFQIGLPLMGIPGLTVSTGSVNGPTGISPVGVQLIANRFREDILIEAGRCLENAYGVRQVVES